VSAQPGDRPLPSHAQPVLSVFVVNYNHSRYLPEALDSLLAQTRPPDEIVVCDDASTDSSWELIEAYAAREPSLRAVRNQANLGVIGNINKALDLCAGRYAMGMASDDRLHPRFLEKSLGMLLAHPEAGLCSTMSRMMDPDGNDLGPCGLPPMPPEPCWLPPGECRRRVREAGPWILGNATVYRREALLGVGGMDPGLLSYCDAFAAMVIAFRHGAVFVPEELAFWRTLPAGYANTLVRERSRAAGVIRAARDKMRGVFREHFDEDFVALWQQRMAHDLLGPGDHPELA